MGRGSSRRDRENSRDDEMIVFEFRSITTWRKEDGTRRDRTGRSDLVWRMFRAFHYAFWYKTLRTPFWGNGLAQLHSLLAQADRYDARALGDSGDGVPPIVVRLPAISHGCCADTNSMGTATPARLGEVMLQRGACVRS
jgi:hypothetical protein